MTEVTRWGRFNACIHRRGRWNEPQTSAATPPGWSASGRGPRPGRWCSRSAASGSRTAACCWWRRMTTRFSSAWTADGRCSPATTASPTGHPAGLREAATELPAGRGRAGRLRGLAAVLAPPPPLLRQLRRATEERRRRPRARCPACDAHHFPRTDPVVIVRVVDRRDRLLLGRQASWPEGRFSVLAGFVEPGETLEEAVRREVLEESGVAVGGRVRRLAAVAVPELADDRLHARWRRRASRAPATASSRRCAGSSARRSRPPPRLGTARSSCRRPTRSRAA